MTLFGAAESPVTPHFSAPSLPNDPFGIYIHIPFCTHICPYCDFNTYANQSFRIPAYTEAVAREMQLWAPRFGTRIAESVFIGGGTPSLLEPHQIASILAACANEFAMSPVAEVTIEANPNDISERYCSEILAAGVNRISIGAQTLDRRGLRTLGRLHEANQVASAVKDAYAAGFENLSLDFIYGWPGQTLERWRSDLDQIISGCVGGSPPSHLSLYGLIVEPGTPMADAVHRGILTPIDDDASADFFELAISMLADAGWRHYEIANWATSTESAARHNAIYWRNGDYAGIGAGAHGHVDNSRIMNHPSPRRYMELLENSMSPASNIEQIDPRMAMGETMMLGLRLLEDGVSQEAFAERHGISITDQFEAVVEKFANLGLLESDEFRVRLTERGAMLANSVSAEFL